MTQHDIDNKDQTAAGGEPHAGSTDASLNASAKAATRGRGWLWALIAIVIVAALGVTFALTRRGANASSGDAAAGGNASTLSVGLKLAPTNLDIRTQAGAALDQILLDNVYEGLVTRDESNKVKPLIAKSWDVSPDAKTYTFHLNEGVTFSNGDKLDAEDAKWSIQDLIDNKYQESTLLPAIASIEATDATTLAITLDAPSPDLLWVLSGRAGAILDKDANVDIKTQAVGSGPFTIESFKANDSITLKANPTYWGAKPSLETVNVKYFADDNAAVNALKSGDVQVLAPVVDNLAGPLKSDPNFVVKAGEGTDKFVLGFNNKKAPLTDKRVRQAIRYAIDHEQIIASRGGADAPLGGPIPSLDPGYEDLTGLYPHDLDKAKQLLAEAGYGPDNPLKLSLEYANTYGTDLGDQLKSQLAEANIQLDIKVVEFSAWLQDVFTDQNYDLSIVDHNESHDFYAWATPTYYFGYDNKQVQDLYKQAVTATSEDDENAALAKAARIVSEDAAADWLFNYRVTTAASTKVSGFPLNLNQSRLPFAQVTVAK